MSGLCCINEANWQMSSVISVTRGPGGDGTRIPVTGVTSLSALPSDYRNDDSPLQNVHSDTNQPAVINISCNLLLKSRSKWPIKQKLKVVEILPYHDITHL